MLASARPALELLEATAPESPIAKFVEKRGPGLHHITLRVDDIRAALAHLKARGVRLVDAEPRPGAERRAGRVHPSVGGARRAGRAEAGAAARRACSRWSAWRSATCSSTCCTTAPFRLDGGAMFGVVPRPLWETLAPADDRNRIQLAMRPLLVEAAWGRMLVDCGVGRQDGGEAGATSTRSTATRHLDHALAEVGLDAGDIDFVLRDAPALRSLRRRDRCATHGGLVPRFAQRALPDSGRRMGRRHASARAQPRQLPAGRLRAAEGRRASWTSSTATMTIRPGVRVERTGGHTGQHQIVYVESGGKTAVFVADLIPTTAHLQDPWVMGYDLFPDGDAGVQAALHPRGHRSRVPDLLRARPAGGGRLHPRSATGRRLVEQVL